MRGWKCGGVGHYARECPTLKGKVKGAWKSDLQPYNKWKSKGKVISHHGDFGSRTKGKGKAFDGECWSCGERGHRAQDCKGEKSVTNIGSVEEEQETWRGVEHRTRQGRDGGREMENREGPRTMASNKEGHQGGADHPSTRCPWGKAYPLQEPARRLKFMNASGYLCVLSGFSDRNRPNTTPIAHKNHRNHKQDTNNGRKCRECPWILQKLPLR